MDIQTATVVIAGISVIIGVINSVLSSRRADQQRQTQLFMELYNRWTTPAVVSVYGNIRYNEDYHFNDDPEMLQKIVFEPFNEEMWRHNHTLINYFEGVAILIEEGFIDINLVENLFSQRIIWCYEYYQSWIQYNRKKLNDYTQYDSLEHLYHALNQRKQQTTVST